MPAAPSSATRRSPPPSAILWWSSVWAFVLLGIPVSALVGTAYSMTAALWMTVAPAALLLVASQTLQRRFPGWLAMALVFFLTFLSLYDAENQHLREHGQEIQATFVRTHHVGKGRTRELRCEVRWGGTPGTTADIDDCPGGLRETGSAAAGTPIPIVYASGGVRPRYGTLDDLPAGSGLGVFGFVLTLIAGLTCWSTVKERRHSPRRRRHRVGATPAN